MPEDDALVRHLDQLKKELQAKGASKAQIAIQLDKEYMAKRPYVSPAFTKMEVLAIVSAYDESVIALQEMGKSDFLDPLGWDFPPSEAVLTTVRCVLWLFNVPSPKATSSVLWSGVWAAWIVKNIDAHLCGWEWVACNEPMGLFTKPYDLSRLHLDDLQASLPSTYRVPPSDPSWLRMPAYLLLRDWVSCAVDHVHMQTHVLPTAVAAPYLAKVLEPPTRTPKENVWFMAYTEDGGVPYYYNRDTQACVLDEPPNFDGARVVVPRFMELQMLEVLLSDAKLRADVEVRRVALELARDKDNAWVECVDLPTKARYYYSFQRCKITFTRPNSRNILKAESSPAYRSVVRIQSAYRRRQALALVREKRAKRQHMPRFASRHFA
ncbi:hypothetical protein SPRG_11421 [Saprolegnia parasitica CBS 223.65]|uniref:WW domain-containing protein n=1 Tax=Saprolegnia parasitica (strain CBS 223.65) TaxID=695850 RepID=A0A067BYY2_SAPPC|nr:hypothetical protein SPRG_11421 [Saprolegnia parasitica CBS 223.65]KDO23498.1 hypothetical protein SPRG_11421 [Saprolegnia parasitica CBS 223.65]|eukprot:XP_012205812.1 hypothetical protein SPRG_11421 [Saprolegnia parasitica CBS 223.65]